ncbi:hypothetical protein GCM10020331_036190 [Ectobacillus funiculus]
MRILGLDVGTKTVGVALSDEMGWTAQGIETVRINEERNKFGFERIQELVKQYNVDTIVVGLPKKYEWYDWSARGSVSAICRAASRIAWYRGYDVG